MMKGVYEKPISLALSGGGVRAMVFHLGVLKYLSEQSYLERVNRISTVSGGSLVAGLIFKEAGMIWPSSEQFISKVYPTLRSKLCNRNMQLGILLQLLKPWNFKYLLSRANLLSLELKMGWGLTEKLSDLPKTPEWSINGTTAENGKRFRFKRNNLGDYKLGYASSDGFCLSDALAVSAAFPGGIGPLSIKAGKFKWKRKQSWDSDSEPENVTHSFKYIHLYDGGVYDNLGLEPFFDVGKRVSKHNDDLIVASDAGMPLTQGFSMFSISPWRLKRIMDIIHDQTRSLRVRTFVDYLQQEKLLGAYIYIGMSVLENEKCQSREFASNYPTTLRQVTKKDFDLISDHGYKVAQKTDLEYGLAG